MKKIIQYGLELDKDNYYIKLSLMLFYWVTFNEFEF